MELAWSAAEVALKGAMIVVLVLVLLELACATTEGAENVVRVLTLVLFMHSAKALAAAALMLHGQNFETGFEIVGNFKLPLFLDSGFLDLRSYCTIFSESEETVSFMSSGIKDFQVPSCRILAGFLCQHDAPLITFPPANTHVHFHIFHLAWRARVLEGETGVQRREECRRC